VVDGFVHGRGCNELKTVLLYRSRRFHLQRMLTHFIGNLWIVQRVVQTTVEAVHLRLRQEVPFIVDVKTGEPAATQQFADIHILMMGFQIVDVVA
jgi:hypothetical protein